MNRLCCEILRGVARDFKAEKKESPYQMSGTWEESLWRVLLRKVDIVCIHVLFITVWVF